MLCHFPRYISAVWPGFGHAQCIVWYVWFLITFSIKDWGEKNSGRLIYCGQASRGSRLLGQISHTLFFQCANALTFTEIVMNPL